MKTESIATIAAWALAGILASAMPSVAQQTMTPTDPTSPAGGTCTGFPGDPIECRQNPQQNATIPEDPNEPDINTQSGESEQDTPPAATPMPAPPDDGVTAP